jgi:hypothetical protein
MNLREQDAAIFATITSANRLGLNLQIWFDLAEGDLKSPSLERRAIALATTAVAPGLQTRGSCVATRIKDFGMKNNLRLPGDISYGAQQTEEVCRPYTNCSTWNNVETRSNNEKSVRNQSAMTSSRCILRSLGGSMFGKNAASKPTAGR